MFAQTGLKKKINNIDDSDEDEEEVYHTKSGEYDKTKNLSRIKDRLFNMQGNVLNFYHKFNDSIKVIEHSNKLHNTKESSAGLNQKTKIKK